MSNAVTIFLFWLMVLGPSMIAMHTNTRPEFGQRAQPFRLRRLQKKAPEA